MYVCTCSRVDRRFVGSIQLPAAFPTRYYLLLRFFFLFPPNTRICALAFAFIAFFVFTFKPKIWSVLESKRNIKNNTVVLSSCRSPTETMYTLCFLATNGSELVRIYVIHLSIPVEYAHTFLVNFGTGFSFVPLGFIRFLAICPLVPRVLYSVSFWPKRLFLFTTTTGDGKQNIYFFSVLRLANNQG